MASTGTATPGEYASDRSRWVAIGLVATTSSLPGRPWLWNSSASWSVNVGRASRPSTREDISTLCRPLPALTHRRKLADRMPVAQGCPASDVQADGAVPGANIIERRGTGSLNARDDAGIR